MGVDYMQPTQEMIDAGIKSLWETIPGAMDELFHQCDDEESFNELMSDTVVFLWQSMQQASK